MFAYDLSLALQSLKRHPGLSALMVLAVALGIAVCTMTFTIYHAMATNPIEWKNDQLYAVTVDTWDPQEAYDKKQPDEPTGNLDSLMARQVMDLLEQINGMGATIVMVTHDPELARRAHRNVQVIDGQITDFKPYEPPHHAATVTPLYPSADAAAG